MFKRLQLVFQATILYCTALILGRRQPGLMRWTFLWSMPLVQDRSLNLLTIIPVRWIVCEALGLYNCAMKICTPLATSPIASFDACMVRHNSCLHIYILHIDRAVFNHLNSHQFQFQHKQACGSYCPFFFIHLKRFDMRIKCSFVVISV